MKRRFSPALLIVMWLAVPSGVAAITLVSVEDEIAIGREANEQMRQQVPELRDAQVTSYVRRLGQRLVRHAPGPTYPYSFTVANYRELNAFALPGGPIWVHRGLLQEAGNESQLVSVLAHEIGHIAQRHAAQQVTNATFANLGLGALGAFLGNSGAASIANLVAGVGTNFLFLRFSRDDEREADAVGLQIMRAAGWDTRGMIEMFQLLQRDAGGSAPNFLSTHPSPQDRIGRLQASARAGGTRDSRQFQAIKARLQRMPAAGAMPRE